jgi:hypothetical protein
MARSTRPPPKASGQQKRYTFGSPDEEEITRPVCPICRCGYVTFEVAAAINKLLEEAEKKAGSVLPKPAQVRIRKR